MITIPPNWFGAAVANAIRTLLTEKHIYQSVSIEKSVLNLFAPTKPKMAILSGSSQQSDDMVEQLTIKGLSVHWNLEIGEASGLMMPNVSLGNIRTYCKSCKQAEPHSPQISKSVSTWGTPSVDWNARSIGQTFFLEYLCEGCRNTRAAFLVSRNGMKLTLAGRAPFEEILSPVSIPEAIAAHWSNAIIARNGGQPLAAIFYLRTAIEQFWVTQGLRKPGERKTGDEMGTAYNATLPQSLRENFPSLLDSYNSLSAAIHSATGDELTFESNLAKIVKHFEARRLFELT